MIFQNFLEDLIQIAMKQFIDQLFKIPKALRNLLGIVILLGVIYFSYSKIYTNEIQELRTEVKNVKDVVEDAVDKDDYADRYDVKEKN